MANILRITTIRAETLTAFVALTSCIAIYFALTATPVDNSYLDVLNAAVSSMILGLVAYRFKLETGNAKARLGWLIAGMAMALVAATQLFEEQFEAVDRLLNLRDADDIALLLTLPVGILVAVQAGPIGRNALLFLVAAIGAQVVSTSLDLFDDGLARRLTLHEPDVLVDVSEFVFLQLYLIGLAISTLPKPTIEALPRQSSAQWKARRTGTLRDSLFPPPRFPISSRVASNAPAQRVHQICNDAVWHSLGIGGRLYASLLALLWPLTASAVSIPWIRRNAASIRSMTGKSVWRQFFEIIDLAVRYRIIPRYYYIFELYIDAHRRQAGSYLMRYETKQIAYRMLRPERNEPGLPIKNKVNFAVCCREHALSALPIIAAFRDGTRISDLGERVFPEGDLFVKPVFGKGGFGAERWNWIGEGRYRSTRGPELSGEALLQHIAGLSKKKPFMLQPAVDNHTDLRDLSIGALSTVRVMTCRDDRGGHEVTNAALRMSINPKSAVDNFHAGGIAAPVDLVTGELGPASDLGLGPKFVWHDTHPLTGGQISGRILPCWQEVIALAVRAHAAFPEWAVIGWDVGILDHGPCLVEGNKGPDVDIIQRTARGPIGSGRFGELLAYNLEQAILKRP